MKQKRWSFWNFFFKFARFSKWLKIWRIFFSAVRTEIFALRSSKFDHCCFTGSAFAPLPFFFKLLPLKISICSYDWKFWNFEFDSFWMSLSSFIFDAPKVELIFGVGITWFWYQFQEFFWFVRVYIQHENYENMMIARILIR